MRKPLTPSFLFVLSTLLIGSQAGLVACGSDDDDVPPATDAGDGSTDASLVSDAGHTTDGSASDADGGNDGGSGDSSIPDSATSDSGNDAGDSSQADGGDAGDGGRTWALETFPFTDSFYAVSGTGPNDVYVSGSNGIYHSAGDGTWTQELQNEELILSLSTDGTGHMYASDLFAHVYERTAVATWTYPNTQVTCGTGQGRGSVVHAIGSVLFESQATELCVGTEANLTSSSVNKTLGGAGAFSGTTQTFALGESSTGAGYAAYFDGTFWQELTSPLSPQPLYAGLVAVGTDALVLTGTAIYQSLAHAQLSLVFTAPAGTPSFGQAWGATTTEAWILEGGTGVAHYTNVGASGATLASDTVPASLPGSLGAIWGAGNGELYAVGTNSTILHKK